MLTAIVLITGSFTRAAEPVEAPRPSITQVPVRLEIEAGTLHGTLDLPAARGPLPVVLIIAGSGPTDRDGNQPKRLLFNDSLKQLARGLAGRGVAVLRYDRRGVGESAAAQPTEEGLVVERFAEDAAAWVDFLRADGRFSTVAVAGHSEGSLVGLLAAKRSKVDAFVSLAGPGRSFPDVLREQLAKNLAGDAKALGLQVVDELAAGRTVDAPDELAALFRPSVQPFLISLFKYDPAREVESLQVPVLIVQGTTDLQVTVVDAERLAAANPQAKLLIVKGMNHVLKPATNSVEQTAAYYLPVPIDPKVPGVIADFLRTRSGPETP